jgi:hypothetical protein
MMLGIANMRLAANLSLPLWTKSVYRSLTIFALAKTILNYRPPFTPGTICNSVVDFSLSCTNHESIVFLIHGSVGRTRANILWKIRLALYCYAWGQGPKPGTGSAEQQRDTILADLL